MGEASSHEANSDTALAQAMKAVKEADAIAVVVDVTENITDADRGLVRQLKRCSLDRIALPSGLCYLTFAAC